MDEKKTKLKELVDLFQSNIKQYMSNAYDEANTRTDFIDKFFELLDWDVRNTQGYSEDYREVVREDKVQIEGKPKAPDYSFRIGKERKFFVEAKKPAVKIKEAINPAYQIRRYGYTAKLLLSILTDFEELAIYDTRIKPAPNDNPSTARIFYCTFNEYQEQWDFLYNTFSKTAILKGSFDRYVQENKSKKGTSEVDKEFLKLISDWRERLAKNIALRNSELDIYNLNNAVQKIIDRIIFLRIAEDRGTEEYGMLQAKVKDDCYKALVKLFKQADDKYNSELFKVDSFFNKLVIDDNVLKVIIKEMYYPDCPYEFSVLPIEVLGNIYEQFLGKTIRLTAGHQAKVEEKPEVRKAGGVYYTPQYIVNYIVENTVGEKIKDKKPEEIAELRILDPACGSGSFLIGAYGYLLDYHLRYYTTGEKQLKKALKDGKIYQVKENTYHLATDEKQRILLNNIYGVDIDSQAVEVTKLSLLLKLMENETNESSGELFKHSDYKMLPNLSGNIKCGNSLIGSDFFQDKDLSLFGAEEMRKVNVFDWDGKEGFPEIMKAGGFDVVVGNPPYVRIQTLNEYAKEQVNYYDCRYHDYISGNYDIYILFLFKGYDLINIKGLVGYILPHKFFQGENGFKIRLFLSSNQAIKQIVDFGTNQIFENATTYTCLFFIDKNKKTEFNYKKIELDDHFKNFDSVEFNKISFLQINGIMWNFSKNEKLIIINKIKNSKLNFKAITRKIFKGSSTGNDDIFILRKVDEKRNYTCYSNFLKREIKLEKPLLKRFIYGQDVRRYCINATENLLLFPYIIENNKVTLISKRDLREVYPLTYEYLTECKSELLKRKIRMNDNDYYKFSAGRSLSEYTNKKILIPDMLVKNRISIDTDGIFYHGPAIHSVLFNSNIIQIDELYFLAILNSSVFWFYIKNTSTALRGNAYRLTPEFLNDFSFPNICFEKEIISLVEQMLATQKQLNAAQTDTDKKLYQQKADLIDKQIDALIYKLYDLTEEEIRIVEGE